MWGVATRLRLAKLAVLASPTGYDLDQLGALLRGGADLLILNDEGPRSQQSKLLADLRRQKPQKKLLGSANLSLAAELELDLGFFATDNHPSPGGLTLVGQRLVGDARLVTEPDFLVIPTQFGLEWALQVEPPLQEDSLVWFAEASQNMAELVGNGVRRIALENPSEAAVESVAATLQEAWNHDERSFKYRMAALRS